MIQILPDSNPSADPGTVLQALNVALQGPAGLAAAGAPKMHRTYRNATKNLLHSSRNMIGLLLPEFDFSWCLPENVLVPQQGMQRYRMTLEEKAMHNLSPAKEAYFLHDPSTGRSIPDFPSANQHKVLRLCFASDEGSDVFGMMQWLCHSQCHWSVVAGHTTQTPQEAGRGICCLRGRPTADSPCLQSLPSDQSTLVHFALRASQEGIASQDDWSNGAVGRVRALAMPPRRNGSRCRLLPVGDDGSESPFLAQAALRWAGSA